MATNAAPEVVVDASNLEELAQEELEELTCPFSPTLVAERPATPTKDVESPKAASSPDNEEDKPTAPPAKLMPIPQPQERTPSGEESRPSDVGSFTKQLCH